MFSEQEVKGELEERGYTPLHTIRLKRSGGAPMPLVVVILPKIEKSQQLFNEHELLDEIVEEDQYSSDSEQSECDSDMNLGDVFQRQDDDQFFIGKDQETIWKSTPLPSAKTASKNIIKLLPGPRAAAKNTPKEIDASNVFITEDMIEDIVTNTNIYIQKKRSDVEYSRASDCRDRRIKIRALFGALYFVGRK
ncbi:unnamed protein product [Acanthoscelides obtectus]|uniref:Uncharacterized protein n=1 Tax=Acanthoscelides obtectus TaxID=200917 RepID=A0A9P0LR69_ACAOB|nr:unnamed protein product [Acanthoscelides obtectus]CAK1626089.1 hypothetical protein AOBTE_LOCUS3601 [Acanthoscelides obtectus]